MIPVRAPGLLRAFAEARVLAAADVHVALRLSRLGGEDDPVVLLAAALAVRAVRLGSVCVDLGTVARTALPADEDDVPDAPTAAAVPTGPAGPTAPGGAGSPGSAAVVGEPEPVALPWPDGWAALDSSALVAVGPAAAWRPLRRVGDLLYLDRYWQQERAVRRELEDRARRPAPAVDLARLPALFPAPGPDRQRLAVEVAATRWVSVLTGGPGTGKTFTVARLLALLLAQPGVPPRIALAAPTGKAAARLQEAVQESSAELGLPPLSASTVHRLLGWRPDSRSRFRHDAQNHLPYDVVVVDEASMLSLTLTARLLDAVRPDARLVLVGDPDQLTSVDAGAVLADLVHRPAPDLPAPQEAQPLDLDPEEVEQLRHGVVHLRRSHRYGPDIGALAEAVRAGDADEVLARLRGGGALSFEEDEEGLRAEMVAVARSLTQAAEAGDAATALGLLGRHRLLCAHRHGPYGVSHWNTVVARWTGAPHGHSPGEPLLVTANDRENALYNGDSGVVVQTPEGLRAAFARSGGPELLAMSRLSSVQTCHAMTVHRSQGSQYDAVSVLLPGRASAVLTRELLYTAVTRARERVRVVGSEQAVRAAVAAQAQRASGLRRPQEPEPGAPAPQRRSEGAVVVGG